MLITLTKKKVSFSSLGIETAFKLKVLFGDGDNTTHLRVKTITNTYQF